MKINVTYNSGERLYFKVLATAEILAVTWKAGAVRRRGVHRELSSHEGILSTKDGTELRDPQRLQPYWRQFSQRPSQSVRGH